MPSMHSVGIAFEHASIHERAGISLVAVADDVLPFSARLLHDAPLEPRRIARAAAAPQSAPTDFLDHLLGRHFVDGLGERGVAAGPDVLVDAVRIDEAAVFEHDLQLRREERNARVDNVRVDFPAPDNVLVHDAPGHVGVDPLVQRAIGLNSDERPLAAQSHTPGADHVHVPCQMLLLQGGGERLHHGGAPTGPAADRRAHEDSISGSRLAGAFLVGAVVELVNRHALVSRRPSCHAASRATASSAVSLGATASSSTATGASPQEPMHRADTSEMARSPVVSPNRQPHCFSTAGWMLERAPDVARGARAEDEGVLAPGRETEEMIEGRHAVDTTEGQLQGVGHIPEEVAIEIAEKTLRGMKDFNQRVAAPVVLHDRSIEPREAVVWV